MYEDHSSAHALPDLLKVQQDKAIAKYGDGSHDQSSTSYAYSSLVAMVFLNIGGSDIIDIST